MSALRQSRHASTWILLGSGVWLIAMGFYFMLIRPPLLPEDLRYMHTTLAQVRTTLPGLENWLARVFTVLGGFMASAGVLTVFVAVVAMPRRLKGTSWALTFSGAVTAGLMSETNFVILSDFRWLLLVPALVWFAGVAFYIVSCRKHLVRIA